MTTAALLGEFFRPARLAAYAAIAFLVRVVGLFLDLAFSLPDGLVGGVTLMVLWACFMLAPARELPGGGSGSLVRVVIDKPVGRGSLPSVTRVALVAVALGSAALIALAVATNSGSRLDAATQAFATVLMVASFGLVAASLALARRDRIGLGGVDR